jgi:Tol biopolymer transport system component
VAAVRTDDWEIWLTDLSRRTETRFTFDPARKRTPVWSPDGRRVAFASDRAGRYNLYEHAADGGGQDELLLQSDHTKYVNDWSRDGRSLLYQEIDPKSMYALWVLPMDGASGPRKPVPLLRTAYDERNGKFSPDGRWVAYESNESGRYEIYVLPFPASAAAGGKSMVSRAGGTQPHWRADGREIYYLAPNGMVMAVPVSASGAALQPGAPASLFKAPPNLAWDVAGDGKRFLFPVPAGGETAQVPFTIVQNWMALIRK